MKTLSITSIMLTVALLQACSRSSEPQPGGTQESGPETTLAAPVQPANDAAAPADNPPDAAPALAFKPETPAGMNPPHGQPNHRCDIPVGAPLDSPPGQMPAAPAVAPQSVPVQTAAAPTAPGMNPPHGQPNHRCDIPVGAPLDSPAAKNP